MLKVGDYNDMKVVDDEHDFGVFLRTEYSVKVLLPRKYVPEGTKLGDELTVFIYTDSEDRLIATTLTPNAIVGEIKPLLIKDVTPVGAFLDWGLAKDLLVPMKCQKDRMMPGRKSVVRVCYDEVSGRVFGTELLGSFLNYDSVDLNVGDQVDLLVYREARVGMRVVVNGEYDGLVYDEESNGKLSIGDYCTGYVKKLRDDGKLDISLQPVGYNALMEIKNVVVEKLQENEGFLPYNAKTDADTVREVFGLSKKAFKKLIGSLYKERVIEITDEGMRLIKVK